MEALKRMYQSICGSKASSEYLDSGEQTPGNYDSDDEQVEERQSHTDLSQVINLDDSDDEQTEAEKEADMQKDSLTAGEQLDEERVPAVAPPKTLVEEPMTIEEAKELLGQSTAFKEEVEKLEVNILEETQENPDFFGGKLEKEIEPEEASIDQDPKVTSVVNEHAWGTGKVHEGMATIDDKELQASQTPEGALEAPKPKRSLLSFFACGVPKSGGLSRLRKKKASTSGKDGLDSDTEVMHGDAVENQVVSNVGLDGNSWEKNKGM